MAGPPALAHHSPVFLAILLVFSGWSRCIVCLLSLSEFSRLTPPCAAPLQDRQHLFSHLEDGGFCQILVVLNTAVLNVQVSCLGRMCACG